MKRVEGMSIGNFGIHSVFYYYGLQHLNVNMHKYMNDGIENNEVIYLCTDEETSSQLKNIITDEEEKIKRFPLDDFIKIYNNSSTTKVKDFIFNLSENVKQRGYKGVKVIAQPSYIINKLSENKFLEVENHMNDLIDGLDISILCIYDFEDYIKEKKFITEETIEKSYVTHKYRLYNMNLVSCENCFK